MSRCTLRVWHGARCTLHVLNVARCMWYVFKLHVARCTCCTQHVEGYFAFTRVATSSSVAKSATWRVNLISSAGGNFAGVLNADRRALEVQHLDKAYRVAVHLAVGQLGLSIVRLAFPVSVESLTVKS